MFNALEKLPSDFYVFHSYVILDVRDGVVHESETDFVVFSESEGLLCIEAKAGRNISCEMGVWRYGSGQIMNDGGPFEQARKNKWKFSKMLRNRGMGPIADACKMQHAVWFPHMSRARANELDIPADMDRKLLMTEEDLRDPLPAVKRILSYQPSNRAEHALTTGQAKRLIREVLCPSFSIPISSTLDIDLGRQAFERLLREQMMVLDFLEEQPCVAINGAAGTGKTVVAIEKAQRSASAGERTLFLCFNRLLRDHLSDRYDDDLIDFFTVDGLAAKICRGDVSRLADALEDQYLEGVFPYTHVIVDEGQDFGQERLEESSILKKLSEIACAQEGGTFYVFYDKMQLVQAETLPECIREAECRVVLRRNCRNTENIAKTSVKSLHIDKDPLMKEGGIKGALPKLFFSEAGSGQTKAIDAALEDCVSEGYKEIVIISCTTLDKSVALERVSDGMYVWKGKRFPITTCRRFKGLEADAVVLIDVTKESFEDGKDMLLYVGSSRARFCLNMVCRMTDDECIEVLRRYGRKDARRPKKALAACLNALIQN